MSAARPLHPTYLGQLLLGTQWPQATAQLEDLGADSVRPLGRTPGGRGKVNADLQLHKPPSPPTPCDGWAIRSGGPTGCHILVSLHTPSIVFFLPSLAGDHQTHLTDKLPDYTESPKMNPVAHVSLELGRTPPKAHALPSLPPQLRGTQPGNRTSSCPRLNISSSPSGLWTPPGTREALAVALQTGCTTERRHGSRHTEGSQACAPAALPPARPSGHAPTASLPRPVQARTCVRKGRYRPQTPCDSASHRSFYTAFHWVCQSLDKNVKDKTTK